MIKFFKRIGLIIKYKKDVKSVFKAEKQNTDCRQKERRMSREVQKLNKALRLRW